MPQLFGVPRDVMPDQHRPHPEIQRRSQLSGLSDQFKADGMQPPRADLGEHQYVLPLTLVDARLARLQFDDRSLRAGFDAQSAHAACLVHHWLPVRHVDRAEGTGRLTQAAAGALAFQYSNFRHVCRLLR